MINGRLNGVISPFHEFKITEAEKGQLNKWIIEKLKDKRLVVRYQKPIQDDPRSQSEQVGDDAMKGSIYGIKNLQRIVPEFMEWTKEQMKIIQIFRYL